MENNIHIYLQLQTLIYLKYKNYFGNFRSIWCLSLNRVPRIYKINFFLKLHIMT